MPLNLLNLVERGSVAPRQRLGASATRPPFLFQFRPGWFPLRGLIYSIALHEIVFAASLVVPWNYWLPTEPPVPPYEVKWIQNNEPLVLPDLKPLQASLPAPSGGAPEGESGGGSGKLSAPAGRPFQGVVHKGPQVIVSNPERPDNTVQTIRQPDLIHPPKLAFPLPLPNMVAVKAPMPVPAAPAVTHLRTEQARAALRELAAGDVQIVPPPVEVAIEHPKLELPAASPAPPLVVRRPQEHASPTPVAPPPVSAAAVGNADRDLLVLNAILTSAARTADVPRGELHGQFAVSPTPPPSPPPGRSGMALGGGKNGSATGTGAGGGGGSGGNGGSGTGAGKAGTGAGSAGSGKGSGRSGSGPGAGTKGTGKGSGGSGGHGAGNGTGPGNGPGTTTVAGGTGAGGPFPGVSIEGGMGAPMTASGGMNVRTPGTYALMIVGGGASGGGLKDYGVFHHETVYTIYVDLAGIGGTAWTMQYAVVQGPGSAAAGQGVVTPPYPVQKHAPEYPAGLASQYEGRLIVVAGTIDTEGKVQKLRLIQGPHPQLSKALMDSLEKCTFGAAQIGDTAVSVKFLLGAPVTAGQ